ncbi:MAG: hypothetical protein AB7S38_19265 [Vulcanimicrobiota bacterium]
MTTSLTMCEADFLGYLKGIKFLVAVAKCVPIDRFPVDEKLNSALTSLTPVFEVALEELSFLAGMAEAATAFVRRDLRVGLLSGQDDYYDRDAVDTILTLYSGERRLQNFLYNDWSRFLDETRPVLTRLLGELAVALMALRIEQGLDLENPLPGVVKAMREPLIEMERSLQPPVTDGLRAWLSMTSNNFEAPPSKRLLQWVQEFVGDG